MSENERCACGHGIGYHERADNSGHCTYCACVGKPHAPEPSGTITYARQFCRVLEPEEHKPDCFVFTVTALRDEVAAWKDRFRALTDCDSPDMAGNAFIREKARADKAEAEVERLRQKCSHGGLCCYDIEDVRAARDRYREALREIAEHLVKMKDGAHNCYACGKLYEQAAAALEQKREAGEKEKT